MQGWLDKLAEPVKIEEGYNHVLSGRYEDGLNILQGYENDERFNTWWPLWYYLGAAYKALEDPAEAERCFKQVLNLSPSNVEAMEELLAIYETQGDQEKVEKFSSVTISSMLDWAYKYFISACRKQWHFLPSE